MKMDDLKKEKTEGLGFQYLGDVLDKKKELGNVIVLIPEAIGILDIGWQNNIFQYI